MNNPDVSWDRLINLAVMVPPREGTEYQTSYLPLMLTICATIFSGYFPRRSGVLKTAAGEGENAAEVFGSV